MTEMRGTLEAQISALQVEPDLSTLEGRHLVLMYRYIIDGNAARVAVWANERGWKFPSVNGGRNYDAKIVIALSKESRATWPAVLKEFADRAYRAGSGRAHPRS